MTSEQKLNNSNFDLFKTLRIDTTHNYIDIGLRERNRNSSGPYVSNILAFLSAYRRDNKMELRSMRSYDTNKGYGSLLLAHFYNTMKKKDINYVQATLFPTPGYTKEEYAKFLSKIGFKQTWYSKWFGYNCTMYADIPNEVGEAFAKSTLEKYNLELETTYHNDEYNHDHNTFTVTEKTT